MEVYNPQAARVTMNMSLDGQTVSNNFYIKNEVPGTTVWTSATLYDACNIIAQWYTLNLAPVISQSVLLTQIVATQMYQNGPVQFVYAPAAPIPGTLTSPALPNNVAAAVGLNTGLAGKSYRGRLYLVGLTESQVELSHIVPSAVTAINLAFAALVGALSGNSTPLVVYSRYENKVKRTTGLMTPVVTAGLRDNVIDSQKRRLPGRGI